MAKTIFEIGERFERLTIISELPRGRRSARRYQVRCDCGNERIVRGCNLRHGRMGTVSCGCYNREISLAREFKHGDAGIRAPEYVCWASMKQRCINPNCYSFKWYGARGIKVCDRWLNYENFLSDILAEIGRRPSPAYSIDRYPNNDGNYEPGNVRWAKRSQQHNNKRQRKTRSGLSKPWINEGISKTTWYRRQRKVNNLDMAGL